MPGVCVCVHTYAHMRAHTHVCMFTLMLKCEEQMIHPLVYILTPNENLVTWIDLTVINQLTTERTRLLWILFFNAVCLFDGVVGSYYVIYTYNFKKFAIVDF